MRFATQKDLDKCKYVVNNFPEIKMWALDLDSYDGNIEAMCYDIENNIGPTTQWKIEDSYKFTDLDRDNYENSYENTYAATYAPIYEPFGEITSKTAIVCTVAFLVIIFIIANMSKSFKYSQK